MYVFSTVDGYYTICMCIYTEIHKIDSSIDNSVLVSHTLLALIKTVHKTPIFQCPKLMDFVSLNTVKTLRKN
jgi:hypothetical protein